MLFTAQEPDGTIIGVFTVTPPHPIIIFLRNDPHMEEAALQFIHFMLNGHIPIYGFVGKKAHVDLLHSFYDKICNPSINFMMQQGVYQLTNLVDLHHASGKMVMLNESSIPFLANCHVQFNQDCQLPAISVTEVFTPNEYRRKGYARTLVWHLTALLLQKYQFCDLYTDLTNPTSNKIYQEIGYQLLYKSKHIQYDNDM